MTTQYVRVTETLADYGKLVPYGDLSKHITDYDKDWYRSVFLYNEKHYKTFQDTGSVSGIVDVITHDLYWDFDCEENIEQSKTDAIELVARLMNRNIPQDAINVCFSGKKGFGIEIRTTSSFNPAQVKHICLGLAKGLQTLDTKIYNAARLYRIQYTKHPGTGLYKTPLTVEQLSELPIDAIKELSKELGNGADWKAVEIQLPSDIEALKNVEPSVETKPLNMDLDDIDYSLCDRRMPKCKFQIMNGGFPSGDRSHALMALGAHNKAYGMPKVVNYHSLKGAAELQGIRTGTAPFDSTEIWNNIISVIYSPNWKGATYSCAEHPWLKAICPTKGQCSGKHKQQFVTIDSVSDHFDKYATDIDKNTVKTGIKVIDDQIRLQTHSHVVIAACSGAGKTTTVLNLLNNVSNSGLKAVMGSLDMSSPMIYQKLAHKVTGYTDKKLYSIYQNKDKKEIKRIRDAISEQYKNVFFDFRSGVDVNELRENLLDMKSRHGSDLKLVVYDFINRIHGPFADETANLNYIAPRLADLANETETLIISLAQIARAKGGPATPLKDSRIAKGSSAIEESATVLFGLWRPGYNQGASDKFLRLAALKTRMGKEFSTGLYWNGLTGEIRELNDSESMELELLESEEDEKNKDKYSDF